MQDITIRTAVAIQNLPITVGNRLRRLHDDEEGQAAVEYGGILAVIALIFIAVFGLGLDGTIGNAIDKAVGEILTGNSGGGGGGGGGGGN
jgi:Flp pilus assembly pilin Flp